MKNSESGIILVSVITLIVVMSILAIGLLGTNASHARSNQKQIDRIRAELLTKGVFFDHYMREITGLGSPLINSGDSEITTDTLDGKLFNILVIKDPGPGTIPPIGNTIPYIVNVSWDN